jgi:hypothetical protein
LNFSRARVQSCEFVFTRRWPLAAHVSRQTCALCSTQDVFLPSSCSFRRAKTLDIRIILTAKIAASAPHNFCKLADLKRILLWTEQRAKHRHGEGQARQEGSQGWVSVINSTQLEPQFVATTSSRQIPPLVGMTASADSHPSIRPSHSSCFPDLPLVEFDPDEVTPFQFKTKAFSSAREA